MAAASSMTTSSACASFAQSWGWMYWCGEQGTYSGANTHLDSLAMVSLEDIDTHDSAVERGVGGLDDLIVGVLLVMQGIEALEHKLKQRSQVLGRWRCHENV